MSGSERSTKRRDACRHKRPFTSLKEAQRHATQVSKRTGAVIRTYQCPECNLWHLTGQRSGAYDLRQAEGRARQERGNT